MAGSERGTQPAGRWRRARANLVHVYTASGVVFAFLATAEVTRPSTDPRWVFAWLVLAVLVDATDGPLARAWEVKRWATGIDGRTIDDIVDYLTFTFVPLLLVWRMGWVPEPAALWVAPALVASLLGFANKDAKDEEGGFFLGFPSYWNIVAFYAGLVAARWGTWPNAAMLVGLTVLSVVPVRFIYPNLAPRPWKIPVLAGAAVWLGTMVAMLPDYPRTSGWLFAVSLLYPVFYVGLSWHLARRRTARRPGAGTGRDPGPGAAGNAHLDEL